MAVRERRDVRFGYRRTRANKAGGFAAAALCVLLLGATRAEAQGAPQPCSPRVADATAYEQLMDFADRTHPGFYVNRYGGARELQYGRYTLRCRDLTGDRDRDMVVRFLCCTGGSPAVWGIFTHDANGQWVLRYGQAGDTVFRLSVHGRTVRATMPAPYEGACTRFTRDRLVRYDRGRFRSRITHRHRERLPSSCR